MHLRKLLSLSQEARPCLRNDIFEIIDYIEGNGLYVKLTSNSTPPIERYERLLQRKIDTISISLDGVEGDNLPYRKVGPKIIDTVRFLYLHRGTKEFYISHTLAKRNQEYFPKFFRFINSNFPSLRIFVQSVVVGQGKLQCNTEEKVDVTISEGFRIASQSKSLFSLNAKDTICLRILNLVVEGGGCSLI